MKRKTIEENVRTPYYESGDNLYQLLEKAEKIGDEEFIESVKKTINQHRKTQEILTKKYLWD